MVVFFPFDLNHINSNIEQKIIIDDLIFEKPNEFVLHQDIWLYDDTLNLDEYIKMNYKYYISEINNIINDYNGTSYSIKSTEILVGDFVLSLMSSIFFKKIILEKLKVKYEKFSMAITNSDFKLNEVTDIFNNFNKIDFHSMLYSEVANNLDIDIIEIEKNNKNKTTKNKTIKNKFFDLILKLCFKVPLFNNLVFGHNINEKIFLNSFIAPFKTLFKTFYIPKNELINIDIEDELDSLFRKELYERYKSIDIILAIIIKKMPTAVLEGLEERKKIISNYFNKKKKLNIFTGVGIYTSSFLKYICFFYRDNIKLNILQHGGLYGMCENHHLGYFYEKQISDNFYQWGNYNNETKILSAYQINKDYVFSKSDKKEIDFLFILSTGHKQFASTGYYSSPLRKNNLDQMLEVYSFLASNYENTIIRSLNYCNEHNYIKKKSKDIKLDKNINFNDSLVSSSVLITDHFGTTYLEAFSSNVPIIVILNRKQQTIIYTKEFEILIREMKKCNLLFDSIEEFIDYFINKEQIINNWLSQEVVDIKEKICSNYLVQDKCYIDSLYKLLKKG